MRTPRGFEQVLYRFSRYQKYTLGTHLRDAVQRRARSRE